MKSKRLPIVMKNTLNTIIIRGRLNTWGPNYHYCLLEQSDGNEFVDEYAYACLCRNNEVVLTEACIVYGIADNVICNKNDFQMCWCLWYY